MRGLALVVLPVHLLAACASNPEALSVQDVLRLSEAYKDGARGEPDCPDDGIGCLVTTHLSPDVLGQKLGLPFTRTTDPDKGEEWAASNSHLRLELNDEEDLFWALRIVPQRQ